MMNKIIVWALGLVASVAATPLELAERSSCRDDSLYKCFVDNEYSQSASAYCSALDPVIQTVTVAKPTVTQTIWVTSTATASTDFISSTTTIYTATVPSSTETATSTATETVTTTATVTAGNQTKQPPPPPVTTLQPAKRGGPQPPKCMLTKCFVYSPERINAACGCINVPVETITITMPGADKTITVTSTSTTTPQVTETAWQTVTTELSNGVSTTTTTVTATATTTEIVTVTPPAANLIPNGDFSADLTGWSIINSFPAAWVNAGVSPAHSPGGLTKAFQITNVASNGQVLLASPSFAVLPSSSYTLSFLIDTTSTDRNLLNTARLQLNCGSLTLAEPSIAQATRDPSGYFISTSNFNTPITNQPTTISQLGRCQVQFLFSRTTAPPVTWFLANVAVTLSGTVSA
ncbi:hypothetical protein V8C42DRAFT_331359 [Trichoderma barbatum]